MPRFMEGIRMTPFVTAATAIWKGVWSVILSRLESVGRVLLVRVVDWRSLVELDYRIWWRRLRTEYASTTIAPNANGWHDNGLVR